MQARRHLWIEGRVQGVGFRASAAHRMRQSGLAGWARNLADGRVEIVVEGEAEALAPFADWCASGPRMAQVTRVTVRDEPVEGLTAVEVW